jgi:hypothetical protein
MSVKAAPENPGALRRIRSTKASGPSARSSTGVFDGLSDEQQTILRDAAHRTVEWAIEQTTSEVDSAQEYCANGGQIVVGADADIQELQRAVQPVYDELEQDQATRTMIEQIRALSEKVDPSQASIPPCERESTEGATAGGEVGESAFPDGVYRMEMTADFLTEAGVDRPTAYNHAGIWTLTFEDGKFQEGTCVGTYSVAAERVTIALGEDQQCGTAAGEVLFSAGWTVDGEQLQFEDVRSGHGSDLLVETLFGGRPWTKIG